MSASSITKKKIFFSFSLKKINLFKILFILFTFGFLCGTILICTNNAETLKQLNILMQKFLKNRTEQSIFITFFSSFFSSIVSIAALFFLGFFPLGQPISFFIPIFHGLGLGLSTAYLYSFNGLKGVIFSILIIAPSEIIFTLILLLGSKFSIKFSNMNFKNLFPEKFKQKNKGTVKIYIKRFISLLCLSLIAAIVDGLTTFSFARFLK